MPICEMRPWCSFSCPPFYMVQYVVAMLSYSLRSTADNETKNLHLHLLMQKLFIYFDFWLIMPSSKKEMLIIFKPDPSRCVDCCIHLYLRGRRNFWGFALFWSCKITLMTMFYHMILDDGRDCVCVYEVIAFSWRCVCLITWESINNEKRGNVKKLRAVLASETKPCVDEYGIKGSSLTTQQ